SGSQGKRGQEIVLHSAGGSSASSHDAESNAVGETNPGKIRLVAGLGNPGPEYAGTRHNIGFVVVDHLAAQFGSIWEKSTRCDPLTSKPRDTLLAKPVSFMNRSGYPLVAIAQFYKIATPEILVVLDDLA